MNGLIYLFGILTFAIYTETRPNGAPQDSCFYMTPRHIHPHTFRRVFPTKAMGLYNITTSADVFRPDRPIRVTLWGPPFKGFLMVAAEEGAKDWPTGIFYSEDGAAKRLSCLSRGDTVTHQNNSYKDSVSVLWYGPENMMSEQIQFIATVVVNLTIYYTNIRSGMLRIDPGIHAAATADPEAAAAGGEGGAPVAVTMDPWLSGQSVTQAPTNWWSNPVAAGGAGAGGWGTNTAWGGSSQAGGWGSNQAAGGGGWGQSGNSGWGSNQATTSSWGGGQGESWGGSSWGNQGASSGTRGRQSSANARGTQQRGAAAGSRTQGASADSSGAWGGSGDWQQWGQGSVTSSWVGGSQTQWTNSDGSVAWGNGQNWQAPGTGKPIWHWNSGKVTTTSAPKSQIAASQSGTGSASASQSETASASNTGSAWSITSLLDSLRQAGFG